MVKLFCAVVGEEESALPINIDVNESVGDLKKAIALEEKYEFPAKKLQLFVAKSSDGMFIKYSALEDLTLDANGCPKDFTSMDQLHWIKEYFKEDFPILMTFYDLRASLPWTLKCLQSRIFRR